MDTDGEIDIFYRLKQNILKSYGAVSITPHGLYRKVSEMAHSDDQLMGFALGYLEAWKDRTALLPSVEEIAETISNNNTLHILPMAQAIRDLLEDPK